MNKAADNYTGGNYDEFIALSKVQKTLRNELKPTSFTAEHIKQRELSQRMNIEHNRVWS